MKNDLITVAEDFLENIDPMEFMSQTSAAVVAWYTKNHTLKQCDMDAMEIYHFHMQQFFYHLYIIKNNREREKEEQKTLAI